MVNTKRITELMKEIEKIRFEIFNLDMEERAGWEETKIPEGMSLEEQEKFLLEVLEEVEDIRRAYR